MTEEDPFFIGELATRSGTSRDAIRYYEELGVLPEPRRSHVGYRIYSTRDVERLDFIGQAQMLGLTLEEIGEVLGMVAKGRQPCIHVRERLESRLAETRERIRSLRELERRLERALVRAEDVVPPERGCRCGIIETTGDGQAGVPSGDSGEPATRLRELG